GLSDIAENAASIAYPLYLFFTIVIITFGIGATMVLEAFNITALGFIFNAALLGGFSMSGLRAVDVLGQPRTLAAVGTTEAAEHRDDVDRVAGLHLVRALHGVGRDRLVALVGRLRPRKLAAAPTPAKLPVPPVHWRRAPRRLFC
ncbi:MAG: hypothetical protein V3T55_06100, partial [Anaerolineales bacterium]